MTGAQGVQVIGADRLASTLRSAADDLARLDHATAQTSRLVQTRARARAPKVSGRLAGSLVAASDGAEARVSSGLIYAPVIHYGWAGHNIRANPFLVPAATDSTELWRPFYVADVRRVLDHVKGM